MDVQSITPILNVSSLTQSFEWFEKLGWRKLWDWGDPPGFGAVGSGECCIFLCQDGQGGRGKGTNTSTFSIADRRSGQIQVSEVLPGLKMSLLEEALVRSQTEDDGAITRWLMQTLG